MATAGLDELDAAILRYLARRGRATNYEVGEAVGLSASAASRRILALEATGAIRGNRIEIKCGSRAVGKVVFECGVGFRLSFRVETVGFHSRGATRCRLALRRASMRARTSFPGTIFTFPESISSRRRLISAPQADSTSPAVPL